VRPVAAASTSLGVGWRTLAGIDRGDGVTTGPNELKIAALGAQGDGIAETAAGRVHVAFALPGERVAPGGEGVPRLLSQPSPERAAPVCRHFGVCGGCAAQHMGERLYGVWKRGIVVAALAQRGLAADVGPLYRVAPGTRRRAVLTARREVRAPGRIALGYHRRRSTELVDIVECPVLVPQIAVQLPALRAIAAALAAGEVRLTVLATPAGLDVAAEAGRGRLAPAAAAGIARIAAQHRLARVAVDGEIVVERAAPVLTTSGGHEIAVPPGAFVQAVEEAERAMAGLAVAAVGTAKRVADLFCGVGTFTFDLAARARVLALDRDPAAIAALAASARRAPARAHGRAHGRAWGLRPIEAKVRDLFHAPLSPKELEAFDAVVLDPPRAGARAQAQQLARAGVPTVVAVSCDPGTLARDARLLVDGGYAIESVTPIDQFLFSAHVEAVAVLRRAPRPSSRRR
jgi:23S rRNA (uracil1939-C5)-methyltransferase